MDKLIAYLAKVKSNLSEVTNEIQELQKDGLEEKGEYLSQMGKFVNDFPQEHVEEFKTGHVAKEMAEKEKKDIEACHRISLYIKDKIDRSF